MKIRPKAMKGISRIDSGSTHGWFVRVHHNRKTYSKLFSDLKNQGKVKALKAAKVYRDELSGRISDQAKALMGSSQFEEKNPRILDLHFGVFKNTSKNLEGVMCDVITCTWRDRKKGQQFHHFDIKTLGPKEALAQANNLLRQKMEPR